MAEGNSSPPVRLEPLRHEKFNTRRFSIGASGSPCSAPNYLRASTGSCHDFCKYGRAHSSEPKARIPFPKRLIKRPPEDVILVKSAVFPEGIKKSPVNRPKSSSAAEIPVTEAPDIVTQKVLKSDRRNSLRGDLAVEMKAKNPAGATKPSLKSSTHSLNAKIPMKKDVLSTNETLKQVVPANGTSRRVLPTKETSKQVLQTSEALKRALPSPKERRLSGSLILPVKSGSSNPRRLSTSTDSSLLRQRRDEIKARESTRPHKRGASKIPPMPSSASPSSKTFTGTKVTVKKVPRMSVGQRMSNGASPRKIADKVKDVEVAKVRDKEEIAEQTLYPVNVEETEGRTCEPVTNESIDEAVVMNADKPEDKVFDPIPSETIAENVEETESKPLEPVTNDSIAESTMENMEETESKSLESVITNVNIVESVTENGEETESSKSFEPVTKERIFESISENGEETESSKSVEPVTKVSIAESISPLLPESLTLSSSDSPPLSLQGEDRTDSEYTISESEYSASEYEEEESDLIQAVEISEGGNGKNHLRKGRHHVPEHEERSKPMKLRFRRGRIIDVQRESDTTRRLRFRQGRMLGEAKNVNSESRRKRREQIQVESNDDGSQEGSTKVVLRHSDVQEKKDAKGLFNNVIEETASKLAETRKSKVKALVGAFETVISLQDAKPSANT